MHWIVKSKNPLEVYELREDASVKLTYSVNPKLSSFRADCKTTKRNFFIEREGFWGNKVVLKNEYGVAMGRLLHARWWGNEGTIELDGEKFRYRYRNNPMSEIVFYKTNPEEPLLACGLIGHHGTTDVKLHKGRELPADDLTYLLFALSWYLFLPVAKEHVVEYAG
jgi:hypothetical protein